LRARWSGDEAQAIKNHLSQQAKSVRSLPASRPDWRTHERPRSDSWFSTGVPVSRRSVPGGSDLNRLSLLAQVVLIACASSQTTRAQRTADSAVRSRTAVW